MGGGDITTAAIIRLCESLEDDSSAFYQAMAERWTAHERMFLTFAHEGKTNKTLIVRTYQETISDAYEASYSFKGLDPQEYAVDTTLTPTASLIDTLNQAINLEEQAIAFYRDVAERSEALLATIPRAFRRVAKVRGKRYAKLDALRQAIDTSSP
jgi:hypothetical protein